MSSAPIALWPRSRPLWCSVCAVPDGHRYLCPSSATGRAFLREQMSLHRLGEQCCERCGATVEAIVAGQVTTCRSA